MACCQTIAPTQSSKLCHAIFHQLGQHATPAQSIQNENKDMYKLFMILFSPIVGLHAAADNIWDHPTIENLIEFQFRLDIFYILPYIWLITMKFCTYQDS